MFVQFKAAAATVAEIHAVITMVIVDNFALLIGRPKDFIPY